jgi:hypothetical protein
VECWLPAAESLEPVMETALRDQVPEFSAPALGEGNQMIDVTLLGAALAAGGPAGRVVRDDVPDELVPRPVPIR